MWSSENLNFMGQNLYFGGQMETLSITCLFSQYLSKNKGHMCNIWVAGRQTDRHLPVILTWRVKRYRDGQFVRHVSQSLSWSFWLSSSFCDTLRQCSQEPQYEGFSPQNSLEINDFSSTFLVAPLKFYVTVYIFLYVGGTNTLSWNPLISNVGTMLKFCSCQVRRTTLGTVSYCEVFRCIQYICAPPPFQSNEQYHIVLCPSICLSVHVPINFDLTCNFWSIQKPVFIFAMHRAVWGDLGLLSTN